MLMSRNPEKLLDIKGRKASIMSKSPQKVGKPEDIKEDLDIKEGKEESMSKKLRKLGHKRKKSKHYVQKSSKSG